MCSQINNKEYKLEDSLKGFDIPIYLIDELKKFSLLNLKNNAIIRYSSFIAINTFIIIANPTSILEHYTFLSTLVALYILSSIMISVT